MLERGLRKTLSVIGAISVMLVVGWLVVGGQLSRAAARRDPVVAIAAAADKVATDPFAAGPALGDVLIIILAIVGLLAILAGIGVTMYAVRLRQRRPRHARTRQSPHRRTLPRPQIASQNDAGQALNTLVQLELTRYMREMRGQGRGPQPVSSREQPLVIQQLGSDPIEEYLREI